MACVNMHDDTVVSMVASMLTESRQLQAWVQAGRDHKRRPIYEGAYPVCRNCRYKGRLKQEVNRRFWSKRASQGTCRP